MKDFDIKSFGKRVKLARDKNTNLSQGELGSKIGVTRATIAQWEGGIAKDLKASNLYKTAKILNVPPEWLAFEVGETPKWKKHNNTDQYVDEIQEEISQYSTKNTEINLVLMANIIAKFYGELLERHIQVHPDKLASIITLVYEKHNNKAGLLPDDNGSKIITDKEFSKWMALLI